MQKLLRSDLPHFMAERLLNTSKSRSGSWRNCEKDSVSVISRHPGDRHRDDLLGQRAQSTNNSVFADGPAADATDATHTIARDAACVAADTQRGRAQFATTEFSGTFSKSKSGRINSGIRIEIRNAVGGDSRRYRQPNVFGNGGKAGQQVRAAG